MQDLTGKVDSAGPPTGVLPAAEWNQLAEEMKYLIEFVGLTLDSGDLTQVQRAVAAFSLYASHAIRAGGANTPLLAVADSFDAYATGLFVRWLPIAPNTGACTVNVNALGVKNLVREDGTNLIAGDLAAGRLAMAYYDGTQFRLLNASLGAPAQALPHRFIAGLHFTPNTTNRQTRIDIAPGSCRDQSNTVNLVLTSTLVKRFDAATAIGTGTGGFPGGATRSVSTWYRVFIVGHTDGRTEVGFDTSATAANLLAALVAADAAGWTYYRQLGWVRSTAALNTEFVPFVQYAAEPDVTHWIHHDTRASVNVGLPTARTALSLALQCPPGALAHANVYLYNNSGSGSDPHYLRLTDKNQADVAPSATAHTLVFQSHPNATGNWHHVGEVRVEVDASSEVWERWDAVDSYFRTVTVPRFTWNR